MKCGLNDDYSIERYVKDLKKKRFKKKFLSIVFILLLLLRIIFNFKIFL